MALVSVKSGDTYSVNLTMTSTWEELTAQISSLRVSRRRSCGDGKEKGTSGGKSLGYIHDILHVVLCD